MPDSQTAAPFARGSFAALESMKEKALFGMAALTIIVGMLLHIYETFFLASGRTSIFSIGFWVLSSAPYIFLAVILFGFGRQWPAAVAGTLALAADLATHYSVFIGPRSSTAGLALLFMPLVNLFIIAPIGLLLGWVLSKPVRDPDAL